MLKRLLAWVRRRLGLSESRDVLRLPSAEAGAGGRTADSVREDVRRRGPLKPGQRRQIVRDERLMPRPPKRTAWTKPPKVMSANEATRLFAGTLRTTNRELRTLDCDEAQLARYGLPLWRNEGDVARALGITVGQLRHFSTHRERERAPHYIAYGIRKRAGGVRIIHAPKKKLKAILRTLNRELVSRLPVGDHAHGFLEQRSVKTGAQLHVAKPVLLR